MSLIRKIKHTPNITCHISPVGRPQMCEVICGEIRKLFISVDVPCTPRLTAAAHKDQCQ